METIGGYIIVAHRTISGHYSDDRVTHAFKNLDAAQTEARARTEKIENTYQDYEGGHIEYRPTLHAVSPKLFEKVQEHLSREEYPGQSSFLFDLGTAITRKQHPYSYREGDIKVFCVKSEAPAVEAPDRPRPGFPPLISSPFVA